MTFVDAYPKGSILRALTTPEAAYRAVFASTVYETEHPVVRVHPVSGQRSLLLGHFVRNFVGLNQADSQRIYNMLQDHITREENVVRWRWQPGDVAFTAHDLPKQ